MYAYSDLPRKLFFFTEISLSRKILQGMVVSKLKSNTPSIGKSLDSSIVTVEPLSTPLKECQANDARNGKSPEASEDD